MATGTRAALYLPGQDGMRWVQIMSEYATAHGWDPVTLVHHWEELVTLCAAGEVQVALALSRSHLDPRREPRLEIMSDPPELGPVDGPRRARRLWHPGR